MDIEEINIRKAISKDAEEISRLIRKNLIEVNAKDYTKSIIKRLYKEYDIKWILKIIKESDVMVAISKNKIIGTGRFQNGFIYDVYVNPDLHGKGIGKKIMEILEDLAVKDKYQRVKLPASKTAIKFYEKLGYKLLNKIKKESLMMEKKLR